MWYFKKKIFWTYHGKIFKVPVFIEAYNLSFGVPRKIPQCNKWSAHVSLFGPPTKKYRGKENGNEHLLST